MAPGPDPIARRVVPVDAAIGQRGQADAAAEIVVRREHHRVDNVVEVRQRRRLRDAGVTRRCLGTEIGEPAVVREHAGRDQLRIVAAGCPS